MKFLQKMSMGLAMVPLLFTPMATAMAAPGDIVDTAVNTPELSALVDLVTQAELVGALQAEGPFTVFAPTNEAFTQLPKIVQLAIERDPSLLQKILLYHVVDGNIMAEDVPRFGRVDTLQGDKLFVRSNNAGVRINFSSVVIPDVTTTNGTVHVIDRVLIPWKAVADSFRNSSS